jgi:hypothetical protein
MAPVNSVAKRSAGPARDRPDGCQHALEALADGVTGRPGRQLEDALEGALGANEVGIGRARIFAGQEPMPWRRHGVHEIAVTIFRAVRTARTGDGAMGVDVAARGTEKPAAIFGGGAVDGRNFRHEFSFFERPKTGPKRSVVNFGPVYCNTPKQRQEMIQNGNTPK